MKKRIVPVALIGLLLCILLQGRIAHSEESEIKWALVPFEGEQSADYIYVAGGYHSVDSGSIFPWGAVYIDDIRFIGDRMGDLVIEYKDGSKDEIPLVFGYTMWFKHHWSVNKEPLASDKDLSALLRSTLHLNGAYESSSVLAFRVKTDPQKTIKKISVVDNEKKKGTPVIDGIYFVKGTPPVKLETGAVKITERSGFFDSHTIDSGNPFPESIKEALRTLNGAVTVSKDALKNVSQYTYPLEHKGTRVLFSGNEFALTASNIFNFNLEDLKTRVDDKGFLHESAEENYNYSYDGIGTYTYAKKGSYYNFYYSRNKGILLLNHYGETQKAKLALDYANNALMYFKNNRLKLNNIEIPGHWTIHVNNPMAYSEGAYPTQYTKEKFGSSYMNIGNSENDGHGLMMLSTYNTWKNAGSTAEWVHENYIYIKEAADWILWNFNYPELSFIKDDVLYSESEGAAWKGYSLYCNMPCYYGLLAYAKMAETAGYTNEASEWRIYADKLKKGMLYKFVTADGIWDTSNDGYPRDPVLTYMLYYYGYDTEDMDRDFLEISLRTYAHDIKEVLKSGGYYAAYGTGYDHGVITQNALLTDSLIDATKLLENLSLVCYSPNHPRPFSVPENYAVDTLKDIVRRQGDLGNLIQVSEVLACYSLVIGVSPLNRESGVLKIMPRLPEDWNLEVENFYVENSDSTINLKSTYPNRDNYTVELSMNNEDSGIKEIRYRLGPFSKDTDTVTVSVNGKVIKPDTFISGDYKWAWIKLDPSENSFTITTETVSKNTMVPIGIIIPIIIAAVFIIASTIYVIKNKKTGRKKNV